MQRRLIHGSVTYYSILRAHSIRLRRRKHRSLRMSDALSEHALESG